MIFDRGRKMTYDYLNDERKKLWIKAKEIEELLESERKKLWLKIEELDKLIKEKTSDNEAEILENLNKSMNYVSQIQEVYNSIFSLKDSVKNDAAEAEAANSEISKNLLNVTELYNEINAIKGKVEGCFEEIDKLDVDTREKYDNLKKIYDNNPDIAKKLEQFNQYCIELDDVSSKIKSTHQLIIKRKSEIDEVYYSIFGYVEKDEKAGTETSVGGLKDELEESFDKLKADFSLCQTNIADKYEALNEQMNKFEESKEKEYKKFFDFWEGQYQDIVSRITELLPRALTAGLSHAFSEKKNQEINEGRQHAKAFTYSIMTMVVISFLPIIVSMHSLLNGISLEDTIIRLPRLVFGILPLYIPVLWFAYSASRKLNLSKRLVEEYSHKEALSKTYEGLSKQIKSLEETCSVEHLKEKLLFNMLEVSAENPGKLISDYNKSDHPLMDALDKSIKLSNSIEKLSRLPGFTRIASVLSARADKLLEEQRVKAESVLEVSSEQETPK